MKPNIIISALSEDCYQSVYPPYLIKVDEALESHPFFMRTGKTLSRLGHSSMSAQVTTLVLKWCGSFISHFITITGKSPYKIDPQVCTLHIVKWGKSEVSIKTIKMTIFNISPLNHMLWISVRIASSRRF